MANWRNLSDPDTQASLASKFTTPIAQRAVAREAGRAGNVADEANRQAEAARRQQQSEMDQRTRDLEETQKEQQRQQEEARQRGLREAQAAGAVIDTDVATGDRKVATHADGAAKFKPGPLADPSPIGQQTTQLQIPGEAAPRPVPNMGVMMGGDPLGSANATGAETRAVWGQQVRDDRGNVSTIPPETKTDEKTGQTYFEKKDPTTDRTVRQVTGQDPEAVAKLARSQRLDFERQALDLERNAFEQTRGTFGPQWSPAKEEFDKSETELKGVQDPAVRFQRRGKAWVKIDPETGKESIASGEEVQRHNQRYGAAKARNVAARAAYEPLKTQFDQLEQQERSLKDRDLKLGREKMLIDMGLPEEDGGVAAVMAKNAGLTQSVPGEDVVNRVTGGAELQERPQPDGSAPTAAPAPLLSPETDAEAVKSAFGALRGIEGLEVEPFRHYTAINKGGKWVANIENGGGSPIVVLRDDARQFEDINNLVALGDTKGVPLYLRENPARKSVTAEATDVAAVYQALQDPAFRDESGAILPTLGARIEQLGATPEAIKTRVDNGELSIQHGESLMKNLYGGTLAVTDPNDPKSKAKWVEETSRMQKQLGQSGPTVAERMASATKGTDYSLADQNTLQADYGRDWYLANKGKPGVTRAKAQSVMGFDTSDGATFGEKVASAATAGRKLVVNDVLGSMFGLGAGVLKDLGAAEVALFGNEGAKKELESSVKLRNRDLANFAQGAKRNAKVWATGDGAAAKQEFDAAASGLQSAIDEVEDSGKPDPARLAAAEARVRQAALKMHELSPDKDWPITEADLDPDREGTLGGALARYKATADPREFELYKERLLMSNGRRQFSSEMEKKMRGKSGFDAAVTGGMNAGWQELGIELAADAAVLASGGASKAAQIGLKGAGAVGKAQRLARVTEAISQGLERAGKLGLRADSLANPIGRAGKIQNAARTAVVGGVGEGVEEVISEAGADNPDLPGAFAMGGLGGMALAPVFIPMANAAESGAIKRNEARQTAENREFATKFNATMAGTPGFTPISPDTAGAARGFVNADEFLTAKNAVQQAQQQLVQTASIPEPSEKDVAKLSSIRGRITAAEKALENAPPDRATAIEGQLAAMREQEAGLASTVDSEANGTAAKMQAAKAYDDALGQLAVQTEGAVAAASEIEATADPAKRAFLSGVAKVATGNGQLLTQAERGAVGGATTRAGAPFFANVGGRDVLTDEGRAEMLAEFPAVGSLIQTTESRELANQLPVSTGTNPSGPVPVSRVPSVQSGPAPANPPQPSQGSGTGEPGAADIGAGNAAGSDLGRAGIGGPDGGSGKSGGNEPAPEAAPRSGGPPTSPPSPSSGQPSEAETQTQAPVNGTQESPQSDSVSARDASDPSGGTPKGGVARGGAGEGVGEVPTGSRASRAVSATEKRYPKLKGKVQAVSLPDIDSAFFATPEGVYINEAKLDEDLVSFEESARDARVESALDEEIVHYAGFELARRDGEKLRKRLDDEGRELFVQGWWNTLTPAQQQELGGAPDPERDFQAAYTQSWSAKLWNELTPEQKQKVADSYQGGFDALPDWMKGAEAIRMLTQIARSGNPTEAGNVFAIGRSPILKRVLEAALAYLRDLVASGKTSPVIKEAIDGFQAMLKEFETVPESEDGGTGGTPASESVAAAESESVPSEEPEPFKRASTQINLPPDLTKRINEFAATIPDEELYTAEDGFGREDESHVTVLYGLTTDSPKQAQKALAGMGPIGFQLGNLSVFQNEKFDVLKFDVHGRDLHRANKALRDNVPFENDFPDYKPHVTVAYLKPGEGAKYVGRSPISGATVRSGEVIYSGKDRKHTPMDLTGEPAKETPKPYTTPKPPQSVGDKVSQFRTEPVIAGIIKAGGMQSFTAARKAMGPEWMEKNASLWNDSVILPPAFNAEIYAPDSANRPDKIAQSLASEGIGDGTVNWLWQAIERAADGARDVEGRRDAKQDPNRDDWTDEEIAQFLKSNGLSAATPRGEAIRLMAAKPSGESPSLPQQVVDQIARGFSPVQRAVLLATIRPGGPSAQSIANEINAAFESGELKKETGRPMTEDAVTNIMDQVYVRLRALNEAGKVPGGLSPEMEQGLLKRGRPERAMTGSSPDVARVQQIREQEGVPDVVTNASVYEEADKLLAGDREALTDEIIRMRQNGEVIPLVYLAAAQRLLMEQPVGLRTPEQQMKMAWLAADWIDQGTDDARRLQIRKDTWHTPAQRAALYFTQQLNVPSDAETLQSLRKAGTREAKEAILRRWMKRRDDLKRSLIIQGIDLDASLLAFQEQQQQQAQIEAERPRTNELIGVEVKKLKPNEKAAVQTMMGGGTRASAALAGNMSEKEFKKVYETFRANVSDAMDVAAQKFIQQALSAAKALTKDEILSRLGLPSWEEIVERELPPAKQKKPKTGATEPPKEWTPEQKSAWEAKTKGLLDFNDPLQTKKVMDEFAIAKSMAWDKVNEFWKASILTGPQSHVTNIASNLAYAGYNLVPRRLVEAGINNVLGLAGLKAKDAASFGEFKPMLAQLNKAFSLGARQALRSWNTESRLFDSYVTADQLQLDFTGVGAERIAPALGGKVGKVMRSLSFRPMTAVDEWIKFSYWQMEVAAQAHRIAAVQEGLKGKAYEQRLAELMQPGSPAAAAAAAEARRITFQEEMNTEGVRAINSFDALANYAKKARNLPWVGKPLSFVLPFVDTPTNIAKQAAEMTPIGGLLALVDATRALGVLIKDRKISPELAKQRASEIYDKARFVRDLTNQTIGLMVWMAVQEMVTPDEDDELPLITGSMPYDVSKPGERANARAVMPPMTIRIGDTQFGYNRLEPFATIIGSLADMATIARQNGGFKPQAVSEWVGRFKNQMGEKTFLQGVGNLIDALSEPKRFGEKFAAGIVTGFVLNIIRQPLREIDGTIRDTAPREDDGIWESMAKMVGYSIVPQAAPPRMDVWGNEIQANRGETIGNDLTDAALRIFDPTNVTVNPGIDPIDKWIYLYNQEQADAKDRIGITPIGDSISITVDGKRTNAPLTVEEQAEANVSAGKMAREALQDEWDDIPRTEEGKDRIIDTYRQAQKVERDRIRMNKIAEGVAIDGGEE